MANQADDEVGGVGGQDKCDRQDPDSQAPHREGRPEDQSGGTHAQRSEAPQHPGLVGIGREERIAPHETQPDQQQGQQGAEVRPQG